MSKELIVELYFVGRLTERTALAMLDDMGIRGGFTCGIFEGYDYPNQEWIVI